MSAARRRGRRRGGGARGVEERLLLIAALALVTFGVVMVFSASSATEVLGGDGDSMHYLKRTLIYGAVGLVLMRLMALRGVAIVSRLTPLLLLVALVALVAVLIPGIGTEVNGSRRWIDLGGPIQFQPSELAKLSLVLFGAMVLARRPDRVGSLGELANPYLIVVALVCVLVIAEPDLGTAMVALFSVAALLVAAGTPLRHLAALGACVVCLGAVAIAIEPYRMERVTSFLSPGTDAEGTGFQGAQARIALGSGGIFGVGPGASVQKAFYLPEAHTDMILAVIGEEWGLIGVLGVIGLYGILGYAGFTVARNARDRYRQLLAAGLTSLILCQAMLNVFAVLGLAPLTGVPLPLVSYGNSSLLVTLVAVGLLLDVARGSSEPASAVRPERRRRARAAPSRRGRAGRLRVVEGGAAARSRKEPSGQGRDRRGRDRRTRGPGPRRSRRAAG